MDFKSLANAAMSAANKDIPLSSSSMSILNELIGSGVFKDKADFVQFVIKAYMQYKMSGGSGQPTQADVQNVIQQTGIGSSLSSSDVEGKLTPLLTEALTMAGKNNISL